MGAGEREVIVPDKIIQCQPLNFTFETKFIDKSDKKRGVRFSKFDAHLGIRPGIFEIINLPTEGYCAVFAYPSPPRPSEFQIVVNPFKGNHLALTEWVVVPFGMCRIGINYDGRLVATGS